MLFDHPEFDNHSGVHFLSDPSVGLRAIIALHRVRPGVPAVGGIRFRPYPNDDAALTDALRLSAAMTLKVTLAGLPVGGGKTVVIGDPQTQKTPELLRALGREIHALGGRYLGGPDVGTSPRDMDIISEVTGRVGGTTASMGPLGSAPPTAEGVFNAVRALAQFLNGTDDLNTVHVAIQGVGAVGANLASRLAAEGAQLTIADIDAEAARAVTRSLGAAVVGTDEILTIPADILAPCALGSVLSESTIPHLRVRGICGAANNQLATAADAERLRDRGIAFVPDYVASAGGVIAGIGAEGVIPRADAQALIDGIFDRASQIVTMAEREGVPSTAIARRMALDLR